MKPFTPPWQYDHDLHQPLLLLDDTSEDEAQVQSLYPQWDAHKTQNTVASNTGPNVLAHPSLPGRAAPRRSIVPTLGRCRRRRSAPASAYFDLSGPRASSWSQRVLQPIAKWLVVLCGLTYVAGQLLYFNPFYDEWISVVLMQWWGVPLDPFSPPGGHDEMVRPTYFLLFTAVPTLVAAVVWEYLRNARIRRSTSTYVQRMSAVLRRKPSLLHGRLISPLCYGELLLALLAVGGNMMVFTYSFNKLLKRLSPPTHSFPDDDGSMKLYVRIIALSLGYCAMFNAAFLFLPATRNSMWMELLNVSYANAIALHRWLGVLAVGTAFFHSAAFYLLWYWDSVWQDQALPCFDSDVSLRQYKRKWLNFFGELAMLMFLFIGITSIPVIRRKLFDLFYYVHQLFVLAVVLIVLHWAPSIWWLLPSFLVYCIGRALSMTNTTAPVKVKEVTVIAHDLVRVIFSRAPGIDGHYSVGQFLYLNVPAISKLQWHAFTITSSPHASPTTVTVMLKALGDWTQDLVVHAHECKSKHVLPTVYVDGYYGGSLELYDEYATVCLIGGGIGATPMFAILEDLAVKVAASQSLQQRVVFVFSFRELALLVEIHPVLEKLRKLDPSGQYFRTYLFFTGAWTDIALHKESRILRSSASSKTVDFQEPLRSPWLRATAWVAVFAVVGIVVVVMTFDTGLIQRGDAKLWMLQQFVDVAAIIIMAAAVCFLAIVEGRYRHSTDRPHHDASSFLPMASRAGPRDDAVTKLIGASTYEELIALNKVAISQRPDMEELLRQTLDFHCYSMRATDAAREAIGTFVSGPAPLKHAVDRGVAGLGPHHFDVHMEEFDL